MMGSGKVPMPEIHHRNNCCSYYPPYREWTKRKYFKRWYKYGSQKDPIDLPGHIPQHLINKYWKKAAERKNNVSKTIKVHIKITCNSIIKTWLLSHVAARTHPHLTATVWTDEPNAIPRHFLEIIKTLGHLCPHLSNIFEEIVLNDAMSLFTFNYIVKLLFLTIFTSSTCMFSYCTSFVFEQRSQPFWHPWIFA